MKQDKSEAKLISLGILANKLRLTKSKLAYYNSVGLIMPAEVMVGGMKIFDESETIKKIKKIIKLQEDGLSLKEIKEKLMSLDN